MSTAEASQTHRFRVTRESAHAARVKDGDSSLHSTLATATNNAIASLYALPSGHIYGYTVDVATREEIIAMSVMEITTTNGSCIGNHGSNTDPRLGAIRRGENCATDGLPSMLDSGHYGYINLNCHILNPTEEIRKRFKYAMNCICDTCFLPVVPSAEARSIMSGPEKYGEKLEKLMKRADGAKCPRPAANGKPGDCKGQAFTFEDKDMNRAGFLGDYDLESIQIIIEQLTDDDLIDIGYNRRPAHLGYIMSVLLVIPHRNRVAAPTTYGTIDHHELSKYYDKILKAAQSVPPKVPGSSSSKRGGNSVDASRKKMESERNDKISELSKLIEDMYKACYKKSLTAKETGIIRNQHGGKTVPGSSRSVIVPAPDLPVTHGKIPAEMARITSIRHTVTKENYEFVDSLMKFGKIKTIFSGGVTSMPGISVKDGAMYVLEYGDVIDRDVVGGDIAIFNRPPTLHEAAVVPVWLTLDNGDPIFSDSAVSHDVDSEYTDNAFGNLMENTESYVVGVPLQQTPAKAADYDGDEDAVVVSQTDDAMYEMMTIQNIANYVIDGQDQKATFAPVQDAILGAYEASSRSLPANWRENHKRPYTADDLTSVVELIEKYAYVSKEYFADIVKMLDSPLVKRAVPYSDKVKFEEDENGELIFSGPFIDSLEKEGIPFIIDGVIPAINLFSLILPSSLVYSRTDFEKVKGVKVPKHFEIRNGIVIKCDRITSASIGNVQDAIVCNIAVQISRDEAVNFVTDSTWVFTSFHSFRGFSIGIGDCLAPTKEIQSKINRAVVKMYKKLEHSVDPGTGDRIAKRSYDKTYREATVGAQISAENSVSETIDPENGLVAMIKSGAKGKESQLYNLIAIVGQKYEDGQIPGRGLTNGTRYTFYYHSDDPDPTARGYISNSLSVGINPYELISAQGNTRSDFIVMSQDTPTVGQASREICIVTIGTTIGKEGQMQDHVGMISPTFAGDNFNPMRTTRLSTPTGSKVRTISVNSLAAELNARS